MLLMLAMKLRFHARKLPRGGRFIGENSGCPGQTIRDYSGDTAGGLTRYHARRDSSVELYTYAKVLDAVKARADIAARSAYVCDRIFRLAQRVSRDFANHPVIFLRALGSNEASRPPREETIYRGKETSGIQTVSKPQTFI